MLAWLLPLPLPLARSARGAVHVVGEIAGATGFSGASRLYAKYRLVSSEYHWHVLEGSTEGYTQLDETTSDGGGVGNAVWNHPIDVHYGTDSMEGWPKLQLEVRRLTWAQ